jgi:hypothetical protein
MRPMCNPRDPILIILAIILGAWMISRAILISAAIQAGWDIRPPDTLSQYLVDPTTGHAPVDKPEPK